MQRLYSKMFFVGRLNFIEPNRVHDHWGTPLKTTKLHYLNKRELKHNRKTETETAVLNYPCNQH